MFQQLIHNPLAAAAAAAAAATPTGYPSAAAYAPLRLEDYHLQLHQQRQQQQQQHAAMAAAVAGGGLIAAPGLTPAVMGGTSAETSSPVVTLSFRGGELAAPGQCGGPGASLITSTPTSSSMEQQQQQLQLQQQQKQQQQQALQIYQVCPPTTLNSSEKMYVLIKFFCDRSVVSLVNNSLN